MGNGKPVKSPSLAVHIDMTVIHAAPEIGMELFWSKTQTNWESWPGSSSVHSGSNRWYSAIAVEMER